MKRPIKIALTLIAITAFIAVAYFSNFLTSDYARASLSPVMP